MNALPGWIKEYLDHSPHKLAQRRDIETLAKTINIKMPDAFVELYSEYSGDWGGSVTYHLLDATEIVSRAEKLWLVGLPKHLLMLTFDNGDCWLFLDYLNDYVYNVCFDSGYKEMEEGLAEPDWYSFSEFIQDYFRKEIALKQERNSLDN